jgi:hypothetical protein
VAVLALVARSEVVKQDQRSESEPPPYRLGTISVRGFDSHSNRFLEDLSGHSWNQLDLCLLVSVEVAGKPGQHAPSRSVQVTVSQASQPERKQNRRLGPLDKKSGRYYVPVWIPGPFCEDLTVRADLRGQEEPSTVEKTMSFRCGE